MLSSDTVMIKLNYCFKTEGLQSWNIHVHWKILFTCDILLQVLGEIPFDGKCVQALDSTRGGQVVAVGGQLKSIKTGVIS